MSEPGEMLTFRVGREDAKATRERAARHGVTLSDFLRSVAKPPEQRNYYTGSGAVTHIAATGARFTNWTGQPEQRGCAHWSACGGAR